MINNSKKLKQTKKLNVLIIGGTSGIGKEISNILIKKDINIISISRLKLKKENHFICDVGNLESLKNTLELIQKSIKKIDSIICVVGFAKAKEIKKLTKKDWEETINKNFTYIDITFKSLKNKLLKSENPVFITMGSRWSLNTNCDELKPYIIAKHALRSLIRIINEENPSITAINYIVPPMNTPGFKIVSDSFKKINKNNNFKPKKIFSPKVIAKKIVKEISFIENNFNKSIKF